MQLLYFPRAHAGPAKCPRCLDAARPEPAGNRHTHRCVTCAEEFDGALSDRAGEDTDGHGTCTACGWVTPASELSDSGFGHGDVCEKCRHNITRAADMAEDWYQE